MSFDCNCTCGYDELKCVCPGKLIVGCAGEKLPSFMDSLNKQFIKSFPDYKCMCGHGEWCDACSPSMAKEKKEKEQPLQQQAAPTPDETELTKALAPLKESITVLQEEMGQILAERNAFINGDGQIGALQKAIFNLREDFKSLATEKGTIEQEVNYVSNTVRQILKAIMSDNYMSDLKKYGDIIDQDKSALAILFKLHGGDDNY